MYGAKDVVVEEENKVKANASTLVDFNDYTFILLSKERLRVQFIRIIKSFSTRPRFVLLASPP